MKTVLLFVLTFSYPDGSRHRVPVAELDEATCLTAMLAVWDQPVETVAWDELGGVPAIDAACEPLGWEGR